MTGRGGDIKHTVYNNNNNIPDIRYIRTYPKQCNVLNNTIAQRVARS